MFDFKKHQKYFVLLGGFLLHLTIGNMYTYNNISRSLISYMQNHSLSGNSVTENNAVWILSLSVFGLGSSVSLGGIIANRIGPSLTVLLGGWFMSFNIMLMSFTISSYLSLVIISYGLCTGIGSGIVYGVVIGTTCQWFPNRIGIVCGIIVSGFGLSSMIIDVLQTIVDKDSFTWIPITYIIIGGCCIILQFIGSLLLSDPPEISRIENNKDISNRETKLTDFTCNMESFEIEIKPHQLYLELDYWVMWITFAFLSVSFTLIVSMTKNFGADLNLSDELPYKILSIISIIGAIFNCLGRIFWGFFIDKVRYKVVILILSISLSIFFGTFYIAKAIANSKINNNGTLLFYTIWIIFLYFISSGIFSIFPQNCFKLFGSRHFVANYGMLFTAYSFGGLITGLIVTLSGRNYWGMCVAGSVISLLAAMVTVIYRGKSLVHRSAIFD